MHAVIPDRPARVAVPSLPAVAGGAAARVAGAALGLAVVLSAAAYAGQPALVVAAVVCSAALAAGWTSLLNLPSPRGTTTVVAASGALSAVAVGVTSAEPLLEWLAPALAAAVVGEFVHQLGRRDGRPRMVESVCGSVAGAVLLGSLAAVVALPRSPVSAAGVLIWAVPVALGVAVQALRLPGRLAVPIGVLVAALTGALLGALLLGSASTLGLTGVPDAGPGGFVPDGSLAGAVTGAAGAAVAVLLHRLLAVLPRAGRTPGWLALAIAPLSASGMVGYVVLRLLVG
jgi:hypothetical protein